MMSYLDLTIREIHDALISKKVTPLTLVKEAISRAKSNNDNAFEYICEDEAITFASTLGEPETTNLLWGIPYVAKDNFSTKDILTTASSNSLNGYVPLYDATVIDILKQKNAILIGKTTLDELAMGGTGTTGHKGRTYNPHDPSHDRMIGGSSCGSAAAVSAGIVPFALGSDTGDSIRKPANYAGLVGMKPTWGRISRHGLFPFAPSLDHVGFFTRCVTDATILTEALSVPDAMDATCSERLFVDVLPRLDTSINGKRIAVIHEIISSKHEAYIKEQFEKTLQKLRDLGAIVDVVHIRKDLLGAAYPIYLTISCAEATSNNAALDGIKYGPTFWGDTYEDVMVKARTAGFSELIKRRFIIGSFALLRENQDVLFLRAQKGRRLIVDAFNEVFKQYDVIIVPAAPTVAPRFGEKTNKLSDEYLIADNHMVIGNFGGFPSLTLPIGLHEKLPFGLHIMGRHYEEDVVLQVATHIEKTTELKNLLARTEGNL